MCYGSFVLRVYAHKVNVVSMVCKKKLRALSSRSRVWFKIWFWLWYGVEYVYT